jgi:hypothetical protein
MWGSRAVKAISFLAGEISTVFRKEDGREPGCMLWEGQLLQNAAVD